MSADPDRVLLAASVAFAGAAVAGSAAAVRGQLPGQPCGISVPLSIPAGLLAGWGAGVAAPWPMPLAAVIAAARSRCTEPSALTGAVCAGIGMGCVLGTAVEPVTRRPRIGCAANLGEAGGRADRDDRRTGPRRSVPDRPGLDVGAIRSRAGAGDRGEQATA